MDIGQRIAEIRKEARLSQEAFGEALGVSRQAISKWESGVSIPDVEKLILLSKLYGTPVGWILGVEEKRENGELSTAQLEMVREIVKQYVEALSENRPHAVPDTEPDAEPESEAQAEYPDAQGTPRRRRLPYFLIAAALCVVLFWCIRLSDKLSDLGNLYNNLQYQVYSLQDSLNSQTANLTSRIESILDAQNSLIADYKYEIKAYDLTAGTVDIEASIIPKTYTPGMEVSFSVESGGESFKCSGIEGSGHRFSGAVTARLTDSMSVSAALIKSDTTDTQLLGVIEYALSETLPDCFFTQAPMLWGMTDEEIQSISGMEMPMEIIENSIAEIADTAVSVKSVEFVVVKNNERIYTAPGEPRVDDGGTKYWSHSYTYDIDAQEGDMVAFAAVITDTASRRSVICDTAYRYINGKFEYIGIPSMDWLAE